MASHATQLTGTPLLVAGMHRSGTSALMSVLEALGVEVGSSLLPPAKDNALGFWEHEPVVRAHDQFLSSLGRTWSDPSAMPCGWQTGEPALQCRDEIKASLLSEFSDTPLWAIKDPRLCRLIPFWRDLLTELGLSPRFVLVLRHPQEVAESLRRRDQMKPDECHALWLRHLLEVERATRGLPRVFVSYPALLRDWRSVADAIAVTLDLTWPQPPADAAESVDARLDPRMRHHVAPLGAHDGEALPSWLQAAHRAFERAIGGDGSALAGTLDELHKTVIQTDPVLLRLRLEAQVNELSAELGRTRTALDTALSSNSWKLTRPLRALVETLRRPIRD